MDEAIRAFSNSLRAQSSYADSTRLAYISDLQIFQQYVEEQLTHPPKISDLDAVMVAGFQKAEHQRGSKPSTMLRRKATLKRFDQFLRQEGYLSASFFDYNQPWELPHLAEQEAVEGKQYLSDEEVGRLWQVVADADRPLIRRDRVILLLLLDTGVPVSRLAALDLADLDLPNQKLRVRYEPQAGGEVWQPFGKAAEAIEQYLQRGRPELNPPPAETALFVSQVGGRMSRQGIWQTLKNYGKAAGLPCPLSPRLLRHTAAFRMIRLGCSIPEIQRFLGHTNLLSTQALVHRLKSKSL